MPRQLLPRMTVAVLAVLAASSFHVSSPQLREQTPATPPADSGSPPKRRTLQTATNEELVEKYFADSDANANGFISFKEAEAAMKLDRDDFAVFDKDRDGRIDPTEFKSRYEAIKKLGGAFPAPIAPEGIRRASMRSPETLVRAYDRNADGRIDSLELKRLLEENSGSALQPELAMEVLDQDRSGELEELELTRLATMLFRAGTSEGRGPAPKSIAELFGKRMKRAAPDSATPHVLWIPGPVSAFRRLDYDEDGRIDAQDLIELSRPIQVPVRIHALIAAIDTDGDGALSEAEFWASMR